MKPAPSPQSGHFCAPREVSVVRRNVRSAPLEHRAAPQNHSTAATEPSSAPAELFRGATESFRRATESSRESTELFREPAPTSGGASTAPAKWTYQAIYRVADNRVGQWSAPASVTVGG